MGKVDNKYNIDFSIPEMINTSKSISKKITRNIQILSLLTLYVFVLGSIKLPGVKNTIKYENGNILIVLIFFTFFALSVSLHLIKLFILYRQIDNELKQFHTDQDDQITEKLLSASIMTSFIISDSIFSDAIFAGHKRHPSLIRFICLYLFLNVLFLIPIVIMGIDYFNNIENTPPIIVILYIIIHTVFTKFYFMDRSIFLSKCQLGSDFIITYEGLLDRLDIALQDKESHKELDNLSEILQNNNSKFHNLNFQHIFDDVNYSDNLILSLKQLKKSWESLDSETKQYLDVNYHRRTTNRGGAYVGFFKDNFIHLEIMYRRLTNTNNFELFNKYYNKE